MRPSHIVTCMIDAAAARHMSCYGYHRKTTPNIDALAAENVLFRKCFSPGNYTMVGCASYHTGLYAERHGAFALNTRVKEDTLTFAAALSRAGYVTGGFSPNDYGSAYMGCDVGFEYFDDFAGYDKHKTRKRGTEYLFEMDTETHERVAKWLGSVSGQPTYLFVHFLPPHGDYETPSRFLYTWANPEHKIPDTGAEELMRWERGEKPYTQRDVDYVRDLYDENMLYADYNVGLLIEKLKKSGMWEDTLFILLADHGEAFMEHGFTLHNTTMYDEMIHVPLVMKLPAGMEAARKEIDGLVELLDVYPTVAEMADISLPPATVDGKSFLPLIDGKVDKIKDYTFSRSAHVLTPMLSVSTLQHKYIYNMMKETRELYDLKADPLEKINTIGQNEELAAHFHSLLEPALEYYRRERESRS